MEVIGRGWQTDLALLQQSGSTVDHEATYVVVRTPDNPTFYWGNFLLLRRAPLRRDVTKVLDLFARVLPDARHLALGLDDPGAGTDDLAALGEVGLDVESSVVLTSDAVRRPHRTPEAAVRPLTSDGDWASRVELSIDVHADGRADAGYRSFVEQRVAAQRRLVESGDGAWLGAFVDGQLVSSLGIVAATPELARYQEVETHPAWRRHGLAGTLVHAAGLHAFEVFRSTTLVIVADPEHHAIRLYRSLGFTDSERQLQAQRAPD